MSDIVCQLVEREVVVSWVMVCVDQLVVFSEIVDVLIWVYLLLEYLQVNQLVGQWMQVVGMMVWQDSVGNICGCYEGVQEGVLVVLLGFYFDIVCNVGCYDGMFGVLVVIEVVQCLYQQG